MKRVLSFILSLCMLLALVPTVQAESIVDETQKIIIASINESDIGLVTAVAIGSNGVNYYGEFNDEYNEFEIVVSTDITVIYTVKFSKAGYNDIVFEGVWFEKESYIWANLGIVVFESEDASRIVSSGTCGDNLTWILDDEGTLTISGTGEMTDISWESYKSDIRNVIVLDGVTNIGDSAFGGCYSLTSITIPNSVMSIGNYALQYCDSLTFITIPDSVTSIGAYAFCNCQNLMTVTIGNNVTSIGDQAFFCCYALTNIKIPDSVVSIGDEAFGFCEYLTNVTIGNNVTSIGDQAFYCCFSLKSITIPDSVIYIGYNAFGVGGLVSVTIGNNVTSIGEYAFNSNDLTNITIGRSVSSIGEGAFACCDNLTDVYYIGNEDDWGKISIDSDNECLTNATIHYNYEDETEDDSIYMYMESTYCIKDFTTSVTLNVTNLDIYEKPDGYMKSYVDGLTFKSSNESVAVITDVVTESISDDSAEITIKVNGKNYGKAVISVEGANGEQVEADVFVEPKMRMKSITGEEKEKFGFVVTLDEADSEYLTEFLSGVKYNINSVSNTLEMGSVPTYTIYHNDEKTVEYYVYGTAAGDYSIDVDIISAGGQKIHHAVTSSTSYGVENTKPAESVSGTTQEDVQYAASEWMRACDSYLEILSQECDKEAKEAEENEQLDTKITEKAQKLMESDSANISKWINMVADLPQEAEIYCYMALYEAIIANGKNAGIDFADCVDTGVFGTITTSSKIVKKIANAIECIDFEVQYDKYKVFITATGFNGAYTGSIYVRNMQTMKSYTGMINSPQDVTCEVVADYLIALRDLEISAISSVFTAIGSDLKIKSITDLTKSWIKKNLKKNIKIFQNAGFGEIDAFLGICIQYYKFVNQVKSNNDITDFVGNVEKLYKITDELSVSDYTATNILLNKAMNNVKKAETELKAKALDYLYGTGYTENEEKGGFVDFIKSIFMCPVGINVYNSNGELIGYVGDDDIWYTDEIVIIQNGDEKIIYSSKENDIDFKIVGTNYGTLNCVFEEYVSDEPVGRLNFYDIPLYSDKNLACNLSAENNTVANNAIVIESDGDEITPDEYISAEECAAVALTVNVNNDEYGYVDYKDVYVRGDMAVLTAVASDDCIFTGWYDGDELLSFDTVYEFTIKENTELTATFAKSKYSINNAYFVVCEDIADDVDEITAKQEDDMLTITITPNKDSSIDFSSTKVSIVTYADDELIENVDLLSAEYLNGTYIFTGVSPQQEFSVFIWENNLSPLIETYCSKKTYSK